MPVTFTTSVRIDAPRDVVFDAARRVGTHLGSMARYGESTTLAPDVALGLGDEVTWRARHFGRWWTLMSRITELDRPSRFVDEQVTGPFEAFRHVHTFEVDGASTIARDEVSFTAPLGVLGRVADRYVLARYMKTLITGHDEHLREIAESR